MKKIKILITLVLVLNIFVINAQHKINVQNVNTPQGYEVSYTLNLEKRTKKIGTNNCAYIPYSISNLTIHSATRNGKTYSGNDLAIEHPKFSGGVNFPIRIAISENKAILPRMEVMSQGQRIPLIHGNNIVDYLENCPDGIQDMGSFLADNQTAPKLIKTDFNPSLINSKFDNYALPQVIGDLIHHLLYNSSKKATESSSTNSSSSNTNNSSNTYNNRSNTTNTTNTYQETTAERRDRLDRENAARIRRKTQEDTDRINNAFSQAQNTIDDIYQRNVQSGLAKMREENRLREIKKEAEKREKEKIKLAEQGRRHEAQKSLNYELHKVHNDNEIAGENAYTRYQNHLRNGTDLKWESFEIFEKNERLRKKGIIIFYASWDEFYKKLKNETLTNKHIKAYIGANYHLVALDAEGNYDITYKNETYSNPDFISGKNRNSLHQIAKKMEVWAYPSIVFLDENQNVMNVLYGYKTVRELEFWLKMFASNEHNAMKTKEIYKAYKSNFKYTFD